MKLTGFLLHLLFIYPAIVHGQVLKGIVTDAVNNEPLPGATVLYIKDSTGTATDARGNFQLEVANLPGQLYISYIGYEPRKIYINTNPELLTIQLNAAKRHLNEIIISATQFNQKLIDIPAAVHAIDEYELHRNNESVVIPIINRMPGIFMESGGLNTNRISIRGIGSRTPYGTNKVRAYFNDIPLTSGEGESTIEDIDLNALQRVEIIKGPNSSIYGAGLGGTINLVSKVPELNKTSVGARVITGSFGLLNKQVTFGHSRNNASINVNLNKLESDGYRENSNYHRQSATISSTVYGNEDFRFSFLGSFMKLKAYIPSSISKNLFDASPGSAATNWRDSRGYEAYVKSFAGVSMEYSFSEKFKSYNSVFINFRDADEPRPFDILLENSVAAGARTRFEYKAGTAVRPLVIQFGAEVFGDWYKWSTYENLYESFPGQGSIPGAILSDNKERRFYYNLFTQASWDVNERLKLEGGLNFNTTNYELNDLFYDNNDQSGDYAFEPIFSPRLGVLFKVKDTWNVFASVSHGYSMPSLEETLTPDGQINTGIKPESGMNYEAGTKGRWFNNKLYGQFTIYHMDIKNLLVAERTGPDQYIGVNAGRTTHNGLELIFRYLLEITPALQIEPFISYTAADYRFRDYIHQGKDYSGNKISGFPNTLMNVGLDMTMTHGFYLFADFRYVGEAALNDENQLYNGRYSLINFKLGYNKLFDNSWEIDINGGVNNLLDRKYASMILVNAVGFGNSEPRYYYPGLPGNYYFGISLNYLF